MVTANQPTTRTRFAADSDEDLIFYMSLRSEDPTAAEDAWVEFFFRHRAYVVGICHRFQATLGDLGVEDLAQDTFVRVFQKAHTFKPLGCGDATRERVRVRGWMGQIANNLFFSSLRGQPRISFVDNPRASVSETEIHEGACPEVVESDRLLLLREGLGTLTEREREILLASYAWYELGVGCQRMPSEELKVLVDRFQTTAVNIRQIRARALDKLKMYLADHKI
jgi:RNA polymerase sigma factor (sigma-70 family)